jgi:hypothetical protein
MFNPTIDRRKFNKTALLIVAAAGTGTLIGCGAVQDISDWIPLAQSALAAAKLVLTSNGLTLPPAAALAFNAAAASLTDLQGACKTYLSTNPPPQGAAAQVETFLSAVVANFNGFLQQIGLPGGSLLNEIIGLISVVLSTIAGFQNELLAKGIIRTQLLGSTVRVSNTTVAVVPKQRTQRQFVNDWNAAADANAAGLQIPKAAYLKMPHWYNHIGL